MKRIPIGTYGISVFILATDNYEQREWDSWAHKPGLLHLDALGKLYLCQYQHLYFRFIQVNHTEVVLID